ncbi:MAG: Crp/Fnr family transcriptional regulator [Rhodospirillales bacterium]|nr:Crp/Fnr family transcriptional regulator [Rhodospirillales bacterium]
MLESKALSEPGRLAVGVAEARPADQSLLADIDLFKTVGRGALTTIEQACRYRRFSADEHIIDRDALSSDVYFIVRGHARVVNYSVSGREITFADLKQGDYFGELSAIDECPRAAGVVAVKETLVFSLPRRVFLGVLADHPEVAMKVMTKLVRIVRRADERIMDLSTLGAHNRVQAELLRQAQVHTTLRNAALIEPIPVHSDIASRVSTTRETVARVLNDLARKGIVERSRNALLIRNMRLLQSMVQEVRG